MNFAQEHDVNFAEENEESLYEENDVELMQLHYIQSVNADADSNRQILSGSGTRSDAGHQDSTFGEDENNEMETEAMNTSGSPTVTTVGNANRLVPSMTTVASTSGSHAGSPTGLLVPSTTTALPSTGLSLLPSGTLTATGNTSIGTASTHSTTAAAMASTTGAQSKPSAATTAMVTPQAQPDLKSTPQPRPVPRVKLKLSLAGTLTPTAPAANTTTSGPRSAPETAGGGDVASGVASISFDQANKLISAKGRAPPAAAAPPTPTQSSQLQTDVEAPETSSIGQKTKRKKAAIEDIIKRPTNALSAM